MSEKAPSGTNIYTESGLVYKDHPVNVDSISDDLYDMYDNPDSIVGDVGDFPVVQPVENFPDTQTGEREAVDSATETARGTLDKAIVAAGIGADSSVVNSEGQAVAVETRSKLTSGTEIASVSPIDPEGAATGESAIAITLQGDGNARHELSIVGTPGGHNRVTIDGHPASDEERRAVPDVLDQLTEEIRVGGAGSELSTPVPMEDPVNVEESSELEVPVPGVICEKAAALNLEAAAAIQHGELAAARDRLAELRSLLNPNSAQNSAIERTGKTTADAELASATMQYLDAIWQESSRIENVAAQLSGATGDSEKLALLADDMRLGAKHMSLAGSRINAATESANWRATTELRAASMGAGDRQNTDSAGALTGEPTAFAGSHEREAPLHTKPIGQAARPTNRQSAVVAPQVASSSGIPSMTIGGHSSTSGRERVAAS